MLVWSVYLLYATQEILDYFWRNSSIILFVLASAFLLLLDETAQMASINQMKKPKPNIKKVNMATIWRIKAIIPEKILPFKKKERPGKIIAINVVIVFR